MRTITFDADDGRQFLVTEYNDGTVTLAEKPTAEFGAGACVWGPPMQGTVEAAYDYRTHRRIEDVLSDAAEVL